MDESILELKNITKIYGNGVVANKDINFSLKKGEIHAIVGENGAGKSTLMKMLFGMEQPNEGEILFKNQRTTIDSSNKAIEMGIGMVHQHFMLVSSFTVAQNMILGMEPVKGLKIDYEKAEKLILELSEKYNLQVDPRKKVEDLSVGMKQKVEILKALLRGAKILILDEPTAVLTPQETEELFVQLKLLKDSGHTLIFISHKLKEVKSISDRITIMRKGEVQGVFNTKDISEKEISNLMVGRDVILKYNKSEKKYGNTVLKVKNINYFNEEGKQLLSDINLDIKEGQIFGVAGVEGNGQRELMTIITGGNKNHTGDINLNNNQINKLNVDEIRKLGMSYIPEDRMKQGVAGEAVIKENLIATKLHQKEIYKRHFLDYNKINNLSNKLISEYNIKCKNQNQKVNSLSGGNIQKVVVARECSMLPKVLIADQPTRGVDVGAAEFIHKHLLKMREEKTAILLVSADLNEVLELSDALIVMYEGKITAYIDNPSTISEKELGLYMLGIKKQTNDEIRRAANE